MTAFATIPDELRQRPQWVVWRRLERDGRTTKVPVRADGSGLASSTDRSTWASFEKARAAADELAVDGIGYVFAPDDPFVGIDLDEGLPEADRGAIMAALDSYAETSVGGKGVHVIVKATLDGRQRNRRGPFEVYEQGRYFVMTGEHVVGTPTSIEERQAKLEEVLDHFLPAAVAVARAQHPRVLVDLDDQDLIERALAAVNGAEFRELWEGRWNPPYDSQSEADLAFCSRLAFWFGRDPVRIDRVFRSSGLMRGKWERPDYRIQTIEKAISGCLEVYSGTSKSSRPGRDAVGTRTVTGTPDDPTVTLHEFVARKDESAHGPLVTAEQGTIVAAAGLVIFAARTAEGKTTMAVDFSLHAEAGLDYCGLTFPRPLKVLWIQNEGPREAFRTKIEARLATWEHPGPRIWDEPATWGAVKVSAEDARQRLRAIIEQHAVDVVLSDSLTRFGMSGNGTPEETRQFMDWLTEIGLSRDVAFFLLHHPRTRAEAGEDDLDRISGAWGPHLDTLLTLKKLPATGHGSASRKPAGPSPRPAGKHPCLRSWQSSRSPSSATTKPRSAT